jgi:RimJ/RimL family protein N-acetyltransferase
MLNKLLLDIPNQIITPRLILRPPKAGDGAGIHKAIEDGYEDVIKWLNQPTEVPNIEYYEIEARKQHAEWILRGDMRFLIIDKVTQTIMGRTSYPPHLSNWDIPYFGISYMLAKTHQCKGYVTESVNAMIRFAFAFLNARKIEIKCDSENIKSVRVPERLGLKLEATQRGNWPRKDKEELAEIRTYAIFSADELLPLEVSYE